MDKWRINGRWYVSLHNFAEHVRADFDLPKRFSVRDTTLREGEETPGITMGLREKIDIAKLLDEAGVPEIEVGLVANIREERDTLIALKKEGIKAEISCFFSDGPKWKEHIDKCVDAGVDRITIFATMSPERLKLDRKFTEEEVLSRVPQEIEYGRGRGVKMDIGSTDATRTEVQTLMKVYVAGVDARVDRVTIYDTLGIATPEAMKYLVKETRKAIKDRAPILVHHHNDFGIASINTVAAVTAGAVAGDVTVNGLGDRGGHAILEETVCILEMLYGVDTGIKIDRLTELSKTVERLTKIPRHPNKPIVGVNQFVHVTGQHVMYIYRGYPELIEPFLPETVGQKREILFGVPTLDGRTVRLKLDNLGLKYTDKDVDAIEEKMREQLKTRTHLTEEEVNEICLSTLQH